MRLFKSSSGRQRTHAKSLVPSSPPPHLIESMSSIGSELADSDQFEIVVRKKPVAKDATVTSSKVKHSTTLFSYFSKDNDDSTVSSITEGDHRLMGGGQVFYRFHKTYYDNTAVAASSLSSWCCCSHGSSDTTAGLTQRTYRTGTDNTLLARDSVYGHLQPADSRSHNYRHNNCGAMVGDKCCGPDYSVPSIRRSNSLHHSNRRPLLLCRRGGGGAWGKRVGSRVTSEMSASLFDNLSEDEPDDDGHNHRSLEATESRISKSRKKSKPARRGLSWKRK
jgi:hypothetical protein